MYVNAEREQKEIVDRLVANCINLQKIAGSLESEFNDQRALIEKKAEEEKQML